MDVGDPSNLERIEWLYREEGRELRADVTALSVETGGTFGERLRTEYSYSAIESFTFARVKKKSSASPVTSGQRS